MAYRELILILINLEYAEVGLPAMKAKQGSVVCGRVPRQGIIEHFADPDAVEIRCRDAEPDDPAGEDVDCHHDP